MFIIFFVEIKHFVQIFNSNFIYILPLVEHILVDNSLNKNSQDGV